MSTSFLYVPADQPRLVAKGREHRGGIILDLEDSVAPGNKAAALAAAREFVEAPARSGETWVRLNPGKSGLAEARELRGSAHLSGVLLAKAEDPDIVRALAEVSQTAVSLLIESARGVLALPQLLETGVVDNVQIGEIDLAADLRYPSGASRGLDWVRNWVVLHSAAWGLTAPIAPVDANYRDLDAFRSTSLELRNLGFGARACIHPAQCAVADDVFGIAADRLADAHRMLDEYEAALRENHGAFGDASGSMVDAATVRTARRLTGRSAVEPGADPRFTD
jgi:citrate lyase subunit beta/citryl-CoA lyase